MRRLASPQERCRSLATTAEAVRLPPLPANQEHAMTIRFFTAGALTLALLVPAQAQSLLTGADSAEILNAARGYGAARLVEHDNGGLQITGRIEGLPYEVYFQNCDSDGNCEDLNFHLSLPELSLTAEQINDWNYRKRFGRAYLDPNGVAAIEMDLDLTHGVTAEHLDAQFGIWSMIMQQFAELAGP